MLKIYSERRSIRIASKQFPKKRLDFIAFGLSHFREENKKIDAIIQKLKKGLNIRILTLNPNSIYVKEQQKIENNNNTQETFDLFDSINNDDLFKTIGKKRSVNDSTIDMVNCFNTAVDDIKKEFDKNTTEITNITRRLMQ